LLSPRLARRGLSGLSGSDVQEETGAPLSSAPAAEEMASNVPGRSPSDGYMPTGMPGVVCGRPSNETADAMS